MLGAISAIGAGLAGIGSVASAVLGSREAKKNRELQEDLANTSVQRRVNDAKAAGIHPVYALGMNGNSFNPVYSSSNLGDGIKGLGQSIQSMQGSSKIQDELERLQLDNQKSQNKLLELEVKEKQLTLAKMGQTPAFDGLNPFSGLSPSASVSSSVPGQNFSALSATSSNPIIKSDSKTIKRGYGLDKVIPGRLFTPLPNGDIEMNPGKDLMDWYSESFPDKISYYIDLFRNSNEYAKLLSKELGVDYDVVYDYGIPRFRPRKLIKPGIVDKFLDWLNKGKKDYLPSNKINYDWSRFK